MAMSSENVGCLFEKKCHGKTQIMPCFDCFVWKIIILVSKRTINSLHFYFKLTYHDSTPAWPHPDPTWPLPALFLAHQSCSPALGVQTHSSIPFCTDEIMHVNLLDQCLALNECSISISELLPLFWFLNPSGLAVKTHSSNWTQWLWVLPNSALRIH